MVEGGSVRLMNASIIQLAVSSKPIVLAHPGYGVATMVEGEIALSMNARIVELPVSTK